MKRIACLSLLGTLLTLQSVAQQPTKQETLDWISSKMIRYFMKIQPTKEHPYSARRLWLYENGLFTYTRQYESEDAEVSCGTRRIQIDLNRITNYSRDYNFFTIRGKNVITIQSETRTPNCDLEGDFDTSSFDLFRTNEDQPLFDISLEDGLPDRMEKAIKHLIRLNTNSGNEKF
jgi:hypothetical protein